MNTLYRKRYKGYADTIPYSPNINKYDDGGDLNPFSGGLDGNLGLTLITAGNALSSGLLDLAKANQLKEQLKLLQELKNYNALLAGEKQYNDFLNTLFKNKMENIQKVDAVLGQNNMQNNLQTTPTLTTPTPPHNLLLNILPQNSYAIGGLISAGLGLDRALSPIISGGYSSGVGDVMSKIPGLGIVGGVVNRLTGVKTDTAKLQAVDNTIASMNDNTMAAGAANSFDDTALLNSTVLVNSMADAYKGGLFSSGKARRKNEELRQRILEANAFADRGILNGIDNVSNNQMSTLMSTYAAYGGKLASKDIDYEVGKEYEITDKQYLELIAKGYQIEVLK